MHRSTFSLLSCTVIALLSSSALAQTLSLPSTPVGGSTSFFYQTQDMCSRAIPGSVLGTTVNGSGQPTCSCLSAQNPGTECSKQGVPDAGQTICLVASTYNSGGQQLSRSARCGVCSRRAGSPNARSIQSVAYSPSITAVKTSFPVEEPSPLALVVRENLSTTLRAPAAAVPLQPRRPEQVQRSALDPRPTARNLTARTSSSNSPTAKSCSTKAPSWAVICAARRDSTKVLRRSL
ncbi:hypothetical protein BCR35DRAFT_110214 [Leucosporidium creatinivorum]|uniref:Uncharacterized protein n=1 Tax=Leucosporidium creatinivorum TaxID=106004 RepID=A0A1Y2G234_9BASI|nr:hypothetical protein BCR35DRAFT_110214 [Leucosporidium creatinivorum]